MSGVLLVKEYVTSGKLRVSRDLRSFRNTCVSRQAGKIKEHTGARKIFKDGTLHRQLIEISVQQGEHPLWRRGSLAHVEKLGGFPAVSSIGGYRINFGWDL